MHSLITVEAGDRPNLYYLDVTPRLSVGTPKHLFLFGGSGLGTAIAAMEAATGRPTLWASAQYLAFIRPDQRIDLDVQGVVEGRASSHARVVVSAEGKELIAAQGSFGSLSARSGGAAHQWATMPDAPAPEGCEPMTFAWKRREDDLYGQFDLRVAKGRYGSARADTAYSADGHVQIWVRHREGVAIDATLLAVVADFIPSAVASSVGSSSVANSLDNSLRIASLVPTDWILCDVRTQAVDGGYGIANARLFATDGSLLATSSQTVVVRIPDPVA